MLGPSIITRRERIASRLNSKQIMLLFANFDEDAPVDSDFAYLTDFWSGGAIFAVTPSGEAYLYTDCYQEAKVRWQGESNESLDALKARLGLTRLASLAEAKVDLARMLPKCVEVVTNFAVCCPKQPHPWLVELVKDLKIKLTFKDSKDLLQPFRCIKDAEEVRRLTEATKATYSAIIDTYNKLPSFTFEYEAAAYFKYCLQKQHLEEGFNSIIASGKHAGYMHYASQQGKLIKQQFLLMDVGARFEGYCADVSRTFMANIENMVNAVPKVAAIGLAKEVWNLVKSTQARIFDAIKPSVSWDALQQLADQQLASGLKDLGLLSGSMAEIMDTKSFKAFTVHRLGHFVGLEVHDVGDYHQNLQEGMVITVEPGVYLASNPSLEAINVRLEDIVLVTAKGGQLLVPRENYTFPVNLND